VLLFRYLLEDLDEAAVLGIGRSDPVANAGLTAFRWNGSGWELGTYNFVEPVARDAAVSVTQEERIDAG
jgi:hypothetical protein